MPYYAPLSLEEFSIFTTHSPRNKLLISDNKQMVKMHKLLRYYSYKTALEEYAINFFFEKVHI